jgi:acetyl esterase/lipase
MTGMPQGVSEYPLEKNPRAGVTSLRMNPWLRTVTPIVVFTFVIAAALAKPKADPERMTPVPADQPIPVADLFRPPSFRSPAMNPAGTHFAALVTNGDKAELGVYNLATKSLDLLGGAENRDIYGFRWHGDRRLTFSLVRDKKWSQGLFTTEITKLSQVSPIQRFNAFIPIGSPRANPEHLITWMPGGIASLFGRGELVKIDLAQSSFYGAADDGIRAEIIENYPTPEGRDVISYHADAAGELAFAITSNGGKRTLHRYENKMWKPCPVNLAKASFARAGEKPSEILVYIEKEKDKPESVYRMNALTGELGDLLYQDAKYDMSGVTFYRHPVSGQLLGMHYNRKGQYSTWFDSQYSEMQAVLDKSFPKAVVRILGSDNAEKEFLVEVSSDVRPKSFYRFSRDSGEMSVIAKSAPWIDPERMQPMQTLTYKARDGREIEGYVTLPAGASKQKPAPLIVLPHGGPWARDIWGWDPEVQFLASRGYAVFQPNYRGSVGYDWKFPAGDDWDFVKMHNDVTDGAKAMLKTGLIDRERIAIMGGSFGGYLALTGATGEGDFYRCAVTMAGVFDWEQIVKDARSNDLFVHHEKLLRKLGDPKVDKEKFATISPINRVSQIKIPIFVAHGADDRIAAAEQSFALIAELEKHKISYEKLIKKGELHGFQKLQNRVEYYTAIEAFLAKHLAPRAKTVAAVSAAGGT